VFSAIAAQDPDALQELVERDADALSRRLSRTENRQTALHYVIAPPDGLVGGGFRTGSHYATLDLLIELGADVDARDDRGRTPLAVAMLRGDGDAVRRLRAAGAKQPEPSAVAVVGSSLSSGDSGVTHVTPMLSVPSVRDTVAWYQSIGFELSGEHEIDTDAAWAKVSLGGASLMFVPRGTKAAGHDVSLWFSTDGVDRIYQVLKRRQLDHASGVPAEGDRPTSGARFTADLHDTFYGVREFSILDLNGFELSFEQPLTS
jgi:ankyrin repeat protein